MSQKLKVEQKEQLLRRGVSEVIIKEELLKLLDSGKKLRLKEGFDPSFPDIHLGHMVGLRKLRQFQKLGHQVVLIVGDWTAQIGDPSGASVTRPMLTAEAVTANAETYMQQFFKIVDREKTEVRWQSEWFGRFDLADVIRLTSKFTVRQILTRDDFAKRYAAEKPITVTELLYPMLQAYDSVAIESDVEFGGNDQKFNLLVGRELQSIVGQPPQQVLMTPILTGLDGGRKMSKSLGNYIGVAELPKEMFGKVMSIPDELIMQYYELLTDVPAGELAEFENAIKCQSVNPMELKKRLAREIIGQLYDEESGLEAQRHFEKVVQRKEVPEDIRQIKMTDELLQKIRVATFEDQGSIGSIKEVGKPETEREWVVSVPLLLSEVGLASSRSHAKRLISQECVLIDGKTIYENKHLIKTGSLIKVGPLRWIQIVE